MFNTEDQQWPPINVAELWAQMRTWDAWWTGNTTQLTTSDMPANRPSQYRGGMVGLAARAFWGRPTRPGTTSRPDIHLPLASDLARTSADLLYSDAPTITTSDEQAQELIDQALTDGLLAELTTGAEIGAALGGRYHRVTTDPATRDGRPFITTHGPDQVIPTFTWGTLTAATIVTEHTHATKPHTTWRHLEHHSLDEYGQGHIRHELYEGTPTSLGHAVPLTDHPATAALTVDENGEWQPLNGHTPGLYVVYIPNITPQRRWRHHPLGRHMGRSDLENLDGLLNALDETWTSWMREIRLGKARILAARTMLEDGTNGTPGVFDTDQEIFTALDTLERRDGRPLIEQVQFTIRVNEHAQTVQALTEQIINQAGYSLGSFQESKDTDVTATEVAAREKRTLTTRARKLTKETAGIQQLLGKVLAEQAHPNMDVHVTWPDAVQANPLDNAQALAQMAAAHMVSTRTGVQLLHPDWDEGRVAEEIARIRHENTLEDPALWEPEPPVN